MTILARVATIVVAAMAFSGYVVQSLMGQESFKAEAISAGAPTEDLSPEIASRIDDNGWKVLDAEGRTLCEIWLAKQWHAEAEFAATPQRRFALQPGSLFGVIRLARRGSDIRGQTIRRGVYTLRYALHPVDGNHEGVSPTRDFLAGIKAADDRSPDAIPIDQLQKLSAEAAQTSHPAAWYLIGSTDEVPAGTLRQVPGKEWWSLRLAGRLKDGSTPVDLVVVGHAEE